MSREFIVIRGRRFTGRRQRALTAHALLLYHHLHCQSDLTAAGTLVINVARWATAAADLEPADIDRALAELEAKGLILTDSCTQELLVTAFWDGGPELRNRNHLRGAARSLRCVESEMLRAAVYEASPPMLRDAIDIALKEQSDAIAMPSQGQRDGTPIYVDVDVDVDVDTSHQPFTSTGAATGGTDEEQEEDQVTQSAASTSDEEQAAQAALQILAKRDFDGAKARGTKITNPGAYFRQCLADQQARNGPIALALAAEHPAFPPVRIANAIEPPETIVPPMYVPEGIGKGWGPKKADDGD